MTLEATAVDEAHDSNLGINGKYYKDFKYV